MVKQCPKCGKNFNGRSSYCQNCKNKRHHRNKRRLIIYSVVGSSLLLALALISVVLWHRYQASTKELLGQSEVVSTSALTSDRLNTSASSQIAPTNNSDSLQAIVSAETPESNQVASGQLVNTANVQALFEQYFGQLAGEHALYFQQLSDENGKQLAARALTVQPQPQRSASVIKLFVLVALMQQVAQQQLALNDLYTLQAEDIVGGTGQLQTQAIGSEWTLEQLATDMIIYSDNTATNVLINQIGGIEAVNRSIQQLGYSQSTLQRYMMDFAAIEAGQDNWVTATEVGQLLARLYTGKAINPMIDRQILAILAQQTDHENLEKRLPATYALYNKSGQNAQYGIRNDALLMETPKGTYVVVVLSQNGHDSDQQEAMQAFGRGLSDLIEP